MKHTGLFRCLGGLSLFGALLAAQPAIVSPVEAYTFDAPTRSLRAVTGLLGSSVFGPVLVDALDAGFVAPQTNYAIVFRGDQAWFVSGLGSGSIGISKLSIDGRPDGVAWSQDGSAAVLYSFSRGSIQVISGFPSAVRVAASIDLSPLGAPLLAVAADATGQNVAIGVGGDHGGIYLVDRNKNFVPVAAAVNPIALVFSDDGLKLYAIDGASKQLLELDTTNFASQDLDLSDLADPVAIAAVKDSTGHGVIYVAGRRDRVLRSYDASTQQAIATLPLPFQPTSLQVLGSASFMLAPRTSPTNPLWAFQTIPVPAVYFVPAVRPLDRKDTRKDMRQ